MARIMIHSNAPWMLTGYGVQTRLLMEQLRRNGHEVAVSAFAGLSGADIRWKGHTIMPSGQMAFGLDTIIPHIERWRPDVTITLMDLYKLAQLGDALREYNVAAWLPIDCKPMSRLDLDALRSTDVLPIAMSRFGQTQIAAELTTGTVPLYAPHAVDLTAFSPMDDRQAYREEMGVDGKFVIGINAANRDVMRKGWPEQIDAFSQLHKRHPDTVLLVNSTARNVGGIDLGQLAYDFGVIDAVRFTDQYVMDCGLMDDAMMRRWYSALDVLSLCSYAEGFGVPLIEAQACGTPVITSIGSATRELGGPGARMVLTDPFWNAAHRAWWAKPRTKSIAKAYLSAYNEPASAATDRRYKAAKFAVEYESSRVFTQYWEPIIKELTSD